MLVETKDGAFTEAVFLEALKITVVICFDYFAHFSAQTRIRREQHGDFICCL